MEGKIPLDVFIIEEDKSRLEIIQIMLKQKQNSGIIGKINSIYDNIQPTKVPEKFQLILCNKKYFDANEMDIIAYGLRRIPFFVYLLMPNEKQKYETEMKNNGFVLSGTITGIIDKEMWKCIDDTLKYYKQIQ